MQGNATATIECQAMPADKRPDMEDRSVRLLLLQVAGGLLADSPGFNQPSLDRLTPGNLPDCFPEIRNKSDE